MYLAKLPSTQGYHCKNNTFMLLTCCYSIAGRERITLIARITSAGWVVVLHRASGMLTAHAWTRVNTFLVDTGKLSRTFLQMINNLNYPKVIFFLLSILSHLPTFPPLFLDLVYTLNFNIILQSFFFFKDKFYELCY